MKDILLALDASGRIIGRFERPSARTKPEPKRPAPSRGNCPLCGHQMTDTGSRRYSVDHILKRSDGHKKRIHGDTRNTRIVCQACNGLLALYGQCPGAVVCQIALGRSRDPHA